VQRPASFVVALLAVLALALPAGASAGTTSRADDDAIVVIVGDVTVPAAKTVEGVFIASGNARIEGHVSGDVFVFSGDALVSGRIDGDLLVASGHARLTRTARVEGDVRYGDERPDVSPLARVDGDVTKQGWNDSFDFDSFLAVGGFVIWLAVGFSFLVLGCLLLLMAPRAGDYFEARSRERVGPTIAIGIAIAIALPIAAFLAAITVLGIPLAFGILLALVPLGVLAYTVAAYVLGRRLVQAPRNRFLAFLAGLAILRVAALVPILGVFVGLAAVILGLGLIGVAIGAARDSKPKKQSGPPPPPPPPQIRGT
jgi:cytoskeletal protein CcmA (bactofilin family)